MKPALRMGNRLLDAFFLTRPVLWVPVWGFSAFGYWCARWDGSFRGALFAWNPQSWYSFFWMFWFSASVGAVYILNQIADARVDAMNEGFPLLLHTTITKSQALCIALGAGLIAVALLHFKDDRLSLCAAAALVVGSVYSFKPFLFSGRPFLDFLTNALGYGGIAFGVGWVLGGRALWSPHFIAAAAPYFFLMCAGSISSTLPDYVGDRDGGKRTTAVAFGIGAAHGLATLLLVLAAVLALPRMDWIALTSAIVSLPIYLLYALSGTPRAMEATYKIGGGITMFLAALIYPVMILPALGMFAATWLYFRYRHGVNYPSLLPATHVSA